MNACKAFIKDKLTPRANSDPVNLPFGVHMPPRKTLGRSESQEEKRLPAGVSLRGSAWEGVQSPVTAKVLDEEAWHPQWHCSAPNTPNCRLKLSSFFPKRSPESVCPCRLCCYSFLPGLQVLVLAALAAAVVWPLGEVHKCEDRQHLQ